MIKDIILRPKPVHVFFHIFTKDEPKIALNIVRKTGITHSHVWKLINKFHKNELIAKEKKGREIILTLTNKGFEIGIALKAIHRILDGIDKNKTTGLIKNDKKNRIV